MAVSQDCSPSFLAPDHARAAHQSPRRQRERPVGVQRPTGLKRVSRATTNGTHEIVLGDSSRRDYQAMSLAARTVLCNAALASSVVASMPTVWPRSKRLVACGVFRRTML